MNAEAGRSADVNMEAINTEDLGVGRQNGSAGKSRFPFQGNKKGLLAAVGVGLVLTALLVSVAIYTTQHSRDIPDPLQRQRLVQDNPFAENADGVSLVDYLSGTFGARSFNGSWFSSTEIQYFDAQQNLVHYDVVTNTKQIVLSGSALLQKLGVRPFEITLTTNKKYALIGYSLQRIYRHSITAKYQVLDLQTQAWHPLQATGTPGQEPDMIQYIEWSPDNEGIAFVFKNNVYFRPSPSSGSLQVSTTGEVEAPAVFNGIADWVYEEEMFGSSKALWFSPDGSKLAYVSFDDKKVESISFPLYGDPGWYPAFQYPKIEVIPYPKAGTGNPDISFFIVKLDGPAPVPSAALNVNDGQEYIGTVYWVNNNELAVVDLNRDQNITNHFVCTFDGCVHPGFYAFTQNNGWIDINTPIASKSGKGPFLYVQTVDTGEGRYKHIVQVNLDGTSEALTKGKFSVDSILAWDENNKRIFYSSTGYDATTGKASPADTHLFSLNLTDSTTTCITCNLMNNDGVSECKSNSFALSKNYEYIAHTCSGPGVPQTHVRPIQNMAAPRTTWVNNDEVRIKLANVSLPIIQDYEVPLANNFTGRARLFLPPNYQKGHKYPLLVDVYAGPGSQRISNGYNIHWGVHLATTRDVIYAQFDGRGSGRQSDDLMFQVNERLGTVEIEDQIAIAKWLIDNNTDDVIDGSRTAIWGWSYGGYSTAMVMGTDKQGIYKCGISVAPVTSWVFYDTIYTERYMKEPRNNVDGYKNSDVTQHVANFRNKKYYLIHGNADDNVHYQQSMILSRALEQADILFRQQSYPDENHGLGGVRRHLYHSLEDFLFNDCYNI